MKKDKELQLGKWRKLERPCLSSVLGHLRIEEKDKEIRKVTVELLLVFFFLFWASKMNEEQGDEEAVK